MSELSKVNQLAMARQMINDAKARGGVVLIEATAFELAGVSVEVLSEMGIRGDVLIVPAGLEQAANEIVESVLEL